MGKTGIDVSGITEGRHGILGADRVTSLAISLLRHAESALKLTSLTLLVVFFMLWEATTITIRFSQTPPQVSRTLARMEDFTGRGRRAPTPAPFRIVIPVHVGSSCPRPPGAVSYCSHKTKRKVVTMTSVGIRELKAHLSHYVRLAANGEKVVVTDRGREVAVLSSPNAGQVGLRALMDSGRVAWSGGKPRGGGGVRARGEPVAKTVLDMRG